MTAPIGSRPVVTSTAQRTSQPAAAASAPHAATAVGYSADSSFDTASAPPPPPPPTGADTASAQELSQRFEDMLSGKGKDALWLKDRGGSIDASRGRVKKAKSEFDAWLKANPNASEAEVQGKARDLQKKLGLGAWFDKVIADMIDKGVRDASKAIL